MKRLRAIRAIIGEAQPCRCCICGRNTSALSATRPCYGSKKLGLQPINILELVTFYPMFRQQPAGKTHIRVCRTLSCAMAGGFELMENLCAALEIQRPPDGDGIHDPIAVSADGNYSVEFVECLASCGTAPVCMIGEQLHEQLDPNSIPDHPRDQTTSVNHLPARVPPAGRLVYKEGVITERTADIDCYLGA